MASELDGLRPIQDPDLPPSVLPPILHLGVFAGIAVLAFLFSLPEGVVAGLALAWGLVAAVLHPLNGLSVVVLAIPFFLGEPRRTAFLVFDGLILLTLASWVLHLGRRQAARPWVPYALPLMAFILTSVLALPLNARELLTDLWVYSPLDLVAQTVTTSTQSHVYYLRVLFNLLSAVALFVMAANLARPSFISALAWAAVPLSLVLSLAGILRWAGLVSFGQGYLSLSSGVYPIRLTSIAWNPDYFAQYAILTLPFVFFTLAASRSRWHLGVSAAALVIGTIALALTYQRAAYLAYLVLALAFSLLWARAHGHGAALSRRPWALGLGLAGLLLVVVVADLLIGIGIVRRFQEIWVAAATPHRPHLWRTAGAMLADHPLLGVGTGRFSYFFREYSAIPPREFGPFWGTVHNLYLQLGAERGLLGLAAFGWLVLMALQYGWRALRAARAALDPLGLALIAVVAWLVYGVFQSTFYIHSIEVGFWVLLGLIAACAHPHATAPTAPRWAWGAVILVLLLGGGLRLSQANQYPLNPAYAAGFYHWERQPDASQARWMSQRAALAVTPQGTTMLLDVAAPTPVIAQRPQHLTVWIDGRRQAELVLADTRWKTLRIPLRSPGQSPVLVTFKTAYAFSPRAEGFGEDSRRLGVMLKAPRWE